MRVCVYTLGCRVNQCESEAIADAFSKEQFSIVKDSEDCEIALVNTCTVTSKAEQKARRMIRLFAERSLVVIVTGCYAQMNEDALKSLSEKVVVVPLIKKASLLHLPHHISTALVSGFSVLEAVKSFADTDTNAFEFQASSFSYHSRAYLKVQDGCDNACGYCRVHVARGKSQFLSPELVAERALALEAEGFQEISLTGVNLTMYDHEGNGLGGMLLRLLPQLKETTRIRLSSMEPDHVDDTLIEAIADRHMHPYFHIPVQSASNAVLQRVDRKYSVEHLSRIIDEIRRVKGDPFFGCDVITGLPGEGEKEFEMTRTFLEEKQFAAFHVFPFSPRPDTPLFNARDRAEERVRDERALVLRTLSEKQSEAYLKRQWNRETEVLIENRRRGHWVGTTGNYIKVSIENVPPFAKEGTLYRARFNPSLEPCVSVL